MRVPIPSQQLLGWLGKGGGVKSLVFCKGFCIDTLRIGGTPIFCQPATLTNLGSNRPRWLLAHEVQANADHVIGWSDDSWAMYNHYKDGAKNQLKVGLQNSFFGVT